jgi:RNA polymerase sigma-70 factor (ECF subfamily)
MDLTTHASLLARLAEGVDPTAWAEFHDRYRDLIRGFAGRQGLQPADCDDVTQEVLLNLSKSVNRFAYDPAKGKFRSYLRTMVINTIRQRRRQERGGSALCGDEEDRRCDADPATATAWNEEWQQYHVRRAMQRLVTTVSERDRIAFVRYALEGVSAEQTAREVEASVEQVYQIKSRILKRLRQLIAEQVEEEG